MSDTRLRAGSNGYRGQRERRTTLRISAPFPALVRCRGRFGPSFEEEVALDNLSAHGLSMRLKALPAVGEILFVLIRFTLGSSSRMAGPGVAVRGIVLRADPTGDGRWCVALLFIQHRMVFVSNAHSI